MKESLYPGHRGSLRPLISVLPNVFCPFVSIHFLVQTAPMFLMTLDQVVKFMFERTPSMACLKLLTLKLKLCLLSRMMPAVVSSGCSPLLPEDTPSPCLWAVRDVAKL